MEQISLLKEQVRRKYALDAALFRLTCRQKALDPQIEKAKAQLYSAKADLLEYEASPMAVMMDKLLSRHPEKIESLLRRVRQAEAEASVLTNQAVSLRLETEEVKTELEKLAGCEEQLAALGADPAECRRWKASFLCEAALPALEESHKALLEYRKLIQGSTLQVLSYDQRAAIQGEADAWGEKCRKLLMPLAELLETTDVPFALKGYYTAPTAYIVSAAAEHNRRDRLNRAIDQNLAYQAQLRDILTRLEY